MARGDAVTVDELRALLEGVHGTARVRVVGPVEIPLPYDGTVVEHLDAPVVRGEIRGGDLELEVGQ